MLKIKKTKYIEIFKNYLEKNIKEYITIIFLFLLGIIFGVIFVNNIKENQRIEIHNYLQNFIEEFKTYNQINLIEILRITIKDKIILTILIWFFATTIIGIPIVFGIIAYRGFCLGYTISSLISYLGFNKGFSFILISLMIQNIILIPALITIAVSGFKFYKSIIKNRRKENIKIELIKHTIISFLMLIILCASSFLETYISTNLLKTFIKYF